MGLYGEVYGNGKEIEYQALDCQVSIQKKMSLTDARAHHDQYKDTIKNNGL